MTKKCDLHCHSTASDGVLTPTELVQRAHEQGVNVLALCDHDTVMGIDEAKIEADKLGIELINGVEISTNWEGRGIHIVGLNFDKTHPKMTALLAEQKSLREKRAVEIGHKLEKVGVPNAYEGAKALANGEVTRAHYARYLVQIGKVSMMGKPLSVISVVENRVLSKLNGLIFQQRLRRFMLQVALPSLLTLCVIT